MALLKSIGNTILFILFFNAISCWPFFLPSTIDFKTIVTLDSFITPLILLVFVAVYLGLINDSSFLTVKKTGFIYYVFAFILGLSFVFIQTPLNSIYNDFFGTAYSISYRFEPIGIFRFSAYYAVFIAPFSEEFFFRKFIQGHLLRRYKPVIAILFTSILFAAIHLPFVSLFFDDYDFSFHHAYITLFGGIILGILFYKSKSIGPPVAMHLFWNLGVFIF